MLPAEQVCSGRKERELHKDFCGVIFCVVLCVQQSSDKVCSYRKERGLHKNFCAVTFCVVLCVQQSSDKVCSYGKERGLHKDFCAVTFYVVLCVQQSNYKVCSDRKERRISNSDLYKLICQGFCVETRKAMPTVEENTDSVKRKSNVNTVKFVCICPMEKKRTSWKKRDA